MITRGIPLALLHFLVFGLGLGCAHLQQNNAAEELDHTVDLYWKAVHWQDAVAGSAFVYFDQRADWLRNRDKRAKDLNVTASEVQGERLDPGAQTGTVLVKVTWFLLPSLTEQTDVITQRWIHKDGHWQVISEQGGPLPFP